MLKSLISITRALLEQGKIALPVLQPSPGPKGQNCENCEFGEMFDDAPTPEGWCRAYDRDVTRTSWCDQWVKSSRLMYPPIPVDDDPTPPSAPTPVKKGLGKKLWQPRNSQPST